MHDFTQGPWKCEYGMVYTDAGIPIATMDRDTRATLPVERDSNAHLIAFAPTMFSALERIANHESRANRKHRGMVSVEELESLQRIARLVIQDVEKKLNR